MRKLLLFLVFAIPLVLVSCDNDKVEVYKIPKEGINVAMQSGPAGLVPPPVGSPAQWTKPESWKEQPLSEMRLGSFKIEGPNADTADVSVIAFPGEAGGLISNINRWRGQLQLPPLDEDQLSQATQRTEDQHGTRETRRHQCLSHVALGIEAGARHHVSHLAPEKRNFRRARAIGRRCIEAKKPMLARDLAVGIETLDAHIVEVPRTMHRSAGIRLGKY